MIGKCPVSTLAAACLVVLVSVGMGGGGGCSSSARPGPSGAAVSDGVARLTVQGDWNDLDAAVEVGAGQAECVMYGKTRKVSETHRRYDLKHVSGRRFVLTATRGSANKDENIPITLECPIAAASSGAVEDQLLALIARRLRDLRGVDVATIRD